MRFLPGSPKGDLSILRSRLEEASKTRSHELGALSHRTSESSHHERYEIPEKSEKLQKMQRKRPVSGNKRNGAVGFTIGDLLPAEASQGVWTCCRSEKPNEKGCSTALMHATNLFQCLRCGQWFSKIDRRHPKECQYHPGILQENKYGGVSWSCCGHTGLIGTIFDSAKDKHSNVYLQNLSRAERSGCAFGTHAPRDPPVYQEDKGADKGGMSTVKESEDEGGGGSGREGTEEEDNENSNSGRERSRSKKGRVSAWNRKKNKCTRCGKQFEMVIRRRKLTTLDAVNLLQKGKSHTESQECSIADEADANVTDVSQEICLFHPGVWFSGRRIARVKRGRNEEKTRNTNSECPHCKRVIAAGRDKEHFRACPLGPVSCPLCRTPVARQDLTIHMKSTCDRRTVPCPVGCGMTFPALMVAQHRLKCSNRRMHCKNHPYCKFMGTFQQLRAHEDECSMLRVRCEYCDEEMFRAHLSEHIKSCIMCPRIVCEKCGRYMAMAEVEEHPEVCTCVEVACPLGCPERPLRRDVNTHCEECPRRLILCPKGCSRIIMEMDLEQHYKDECSRVFIPCPLCTRHCTRQELPAHQKNTCTRRLMPCPLPNPCDRMIPAEELAFHRHLNKKKLMALQVVQEQAKKSSAKLDASTRRRRRKVGGGADGDDDDESARMVHSVKRGHRRRRAHAETEDDWMEKLRKAHAKQEDLEESTKKDEPEKGTLETRRFAQGTVSKGGVLEHSMRRKQYLMTQLMMSDQGDIPLHSAQLRGSLLPGVRRSNGRFIPPPLTAAETRLALQEQEEKEKLYKMTNLKFKGNCWFRQCTHMMRLHPLLPVDIKALAKRKLNRVETDMMRMQPASLHWQRGDVIRVVESLSRSRPGSAPRTRSATPQGRPSSAKRRPLSAPRLRPASAPKRRPRSSSRARE
eukprot:Rmarinus@m.11202